MCEKTRCILIVSLALGFGAAVPRPAAAQQPAAAGQPAVAAGQQDVAAAALERAKLTNYVEVLKKELARAEARVKDVTYQLKTLDDDIESRVGRIMGVLVSVRDSTDASSTRMRRAKEDMLRGLKTSAVYYAQQRDRRKKEMGNPYAQIDDETLARDVAVLNARIERRVTQSVEIASSLVQHEEGTVDRYRDWDTNYGSETREYRKGEKDASASAKIKAETMGTLKASIEKLTRDVKAREAERKAAKDSVRQAQLADEIETMRETIEARRSQIEMLVSAPRPATRAVGSKGAFEMDKMLDEMRVELKADFVKFKALVNERDAALGRLVPLRARLEKAEALLATHSQGAPGL